MYSSRTPEISKSGPLVPVASQSGQTDFSNITNVHMSNKVRTIENYRTCILNRYQGFQTAEVN